MHAQTPDNDNAMLGYERVLLVVQIVIFHVDYYVIKKKG